MKIFVNAQLIMIMYSSVCIKLNDLPHWSGEIWLIWHINLR